MQQPSHGFLDKLKAKLDRNGTSRNGKTSLRSSVFTPTGTVVSVNVYDMLWLNVYTNSLGIGVYHTGVVIYGTEYCYGGHPFEYSGIFAMAPQDSETLGPNYSYKTTINLGWTDFTESDVSLILEDMGPQYRGDQYHLLHRNCNHFSNAFVKILCGASLPKWINRLASVGAKLPFVERSIPKLWLTPRPLEDFNSSRSERRISADTDTASFSCPALGQDSSTNGSVPVARRRPSALLSRVHSTLSRRWNQSERPSSSTSFRSLLRRPRDRSISVTSSLANIVDSLDTDLTPQSNTGARSTISRQLSAHARLHEGDSGPISRVPETLEELQRNGCTDGSGVRTHNQRKDRLLNRLTSPVSALLSGRRPSSVYAPNSTPVRTPFSIRTLDHPGDVFFTHPSSPERAGTSFHNSHDSHVDRTSLQSPVVLNQQPTMVKLHPQTSRRPEQPALNCPSPDSAHHQSSANCAQIITSGLLSRLQNLCGTVEQQLHDPIRPTPPFDADTNSLTNSAF